MNFYLIFKSLHLIAVISWMAGLLYLPRIFVYHSENNEMNSVSEIFKTMERKLYNFIMMPAMGLSWLFGIILIHSLGHSVFLELWMQIKIIAVILLTYYHFTLGKYLNDFATRGNIGDIDGVLIPAGTSTVYDQLLGSNISRPFLHVRYRASEADDRRMKSWVVGSVGAATTGLDAMQIHFLSERLLCVQGANNFVLFKSTVSVSYTHLTLPTSDLV